MVYRAEIPYGAYWSTPFARWQGAFASLNSLELAAEVARRELGRRAIGAGQLDHGVLGFSVPQKHSFYGLPWLAGMAGLGELAGPTVMQACSTGVRALLAAAQEVECGLAGASLVVTCDRTSNGPHLYYPDPRGPGGTGGHEDWVMDNFGCDPLGRHAMIQTAENVAKKSAAAESPLFVQLAMEIVVRVPRGTWINLDEGSFELMGDVRARKQPGGQPIVSGRLESVRGWYTFQGRKFELERGEVVFTGGGKEIVPRLDIVARYKGADHVVYLVIGGTTKEPTLNLRSEPPLEQADILSVLLFGKPAGELNQGQQNVLQEQAIQATASFVASGLRQSVARKLGVDSLEVTTGTAGTPGKVAVGKYVKENVYVSASQQLGGEKQQEYSVEYQITPRWQLKGSTESGKNSGFDLFWHKRY